MMLALVFALACTAKDGTTDDSAPAGARSLANCETAIDAEAPDFFSLLHCAELDVDGADLVIHTIDMPPHTSPYYEESEDNWVTWDDMGHTRVQNPNRIAQQDITITIPLNPVSRDLDITSALVDRQAGNSQEEYHEPGIALDGTPMFGGIAAPGDDIAEESMTFDVWEGHPQNTGVYHHHSPTPASLAVLVELGLSDTIVPGEGEVEIYGIMCDGTVVLGCNEADGSSVSDGDLDGQSGHVHDILGPDGSTWFTDRYHTHLCVGTYDEFSPEIQYYEGCVPG